MDGYLMSKEEIIKQYFQGWLEKDITPIKQFFAESA